MNIEYTSGLTLEYSELWQALQVAHDPNNYESYIGTYKHREEAVKKYSWAIPTEEALETIARYSPLVEIGAGTGYWAYELQRRGVKILPFDKYPPNGEEWTEEEEENAHRGEHHPNKSWYHRGATQWTHVVQGTPEVLQRFRPEYNLFLCWPPMDEMAAYSLGYHRGKYIIYIGESDMGCNADKLFFKLLRKLYEPVEEVSIPQWPGLHDYLTIYEHRSR